MAKKPNRVFGVAGEGQKVFGDGFHVQRNVVGTAVCGEGCMDCFQLHLETATSSQPVVRENNLGST